MIPLDGSVSNEMSWKGMGRFYNEEVDVMAQHKNP